MRLPVTRTLLVASICPIAKWHYSLKSIVQPKDTNNSRNRLGWTRTYCYFKHALMLDTGLISRPSFISSCGFAHRKNELKICAVRLRLIHWLLGCGLRCLNRLQIEAMFCKRQFGRRSTANRDKSTSLSIYFRSVQFLACYSSLLDHQEIDFSIFPIVSYNSPRTVLYLY